MDKTQLPPLPAEPASRDPILATVPAPASSASSRRPVGRPRLEGETSDGSPRDAIIAAATKLFGEKGYAHTTMSDIARAVGLQQPSLYYWFHRKELILQATLVVNRTPLEFIGRVGAGSGSPALKLYRLLRYDTYQLCQSPIDFNEIERIAENQPEDFVDFWTDYTRLHEWVVVLIMAGIDEQELIEVDPDTTATELLCLDEAMQKRYRYQDRHQAGEKNPFVHESRTAAEWAERVATLSLRALLRRPADVRRLQKQAAQVDDLV